MAASASDFETATAVRALGSGRYRATMTGDWNAATPNGGILAATIVTAVQAEAGMAAPPVRTVSVQYLDAPVPGEAEVLVERLRAGRRVAVYGGRIVQDGRLTVTATIICSAARQASITRSDLPPAAPRASEVPRRDRPALPHSPRVFDKLDVRPVFGAMPLSGADEAEAGGWIALRGDEKPLDAPRLVALCDLWWPAIFPVLTAPDAAPTIQLTVLLRDTSGEARAPVLARYTTRTVAEGHFDERAELWSAGGRLLAESVQLALLLPLA